MYNKLHVWIPTNAHHEQMENFTVLHFCENLIYELLH